MSTISMAVPTVGHTERSQGLRLIAFVVVALALFAVTLIPAQEVIPEPVRGAVSAVVPDGVEEFLAAPSADALSFGVGWGVYLYFNRNDVQWIYAVGGAIAGTAICAAITAASGGTGAIVCAVIGAIVGKIISDYANIRSNQCLEVRIRWGLRYKVLNNPC